MGMYPPPGSCSVFVIALAPRRRRGVLVVPETIPMNEFAKMAFERHRLFRERPEGDDAF